MSIEEKILKILDDFPPRPTVLHLEGEEDELIPSYWMHISEWTFDGCPKSREWAIQKDHIDVAHTLIEELIKNSSVAECMSSPIQYIRKCKQWYLKYE